jgi:hypothetical protein
MFAGGRIYIRSTVFGDRSEFKRMLKKIQFEREVVMLPEKLFQVCRLDRRVAKLGHVGASLVL